VAQERIECREWTPDSDIDLGFRVSGWSHVGRVRSHNEDSFSVEPPIFVVADGMGGHDAGDVASRIVVEAFDELAGASYVSIEDMERCVKRAKDLVDDLPGGDRGAPGSTLVVAGYSMQDGVPFWLIANIGDSRAYIWRAGTLEQVSRDHSVVQELIESGEIDAAAALAHPERHVITRAIGALEDADAEFIIIPLQAGARLLLCSDGLTGEVSDAAICEVLTTSSSPDEAIDSLVEAALASGGRDNITVVLVDAVGTVMADEITLTGISSVDEDTLRSSRL